MIQNHVTHGWVIKISPLLAMEATVPRHHTERPDCEQRKQPDHFYPN